MSELINHFPTVLLGFMIVLTLVLLPLLNDDRPPRDDRPRTEEIRVPVVKLQESPQVHSDPEA